MTHSWAEASIREGALPTPNRLSDKACAPPSSERLKSAAPWTRERPISRTSSAASKVAQCMALSPKFATDSPKALAVENTPASPSVSSRARAAFSLRCCAQRTNASSSEIRLYVCSWRAFSGEAATTAGGSRRDSLKVTFSPTCCEESPSAATSAARTRFRPRAISFQTSGIKNPPAFQGHTGKESPSVCISCNCGDLFPWDSEVQGQVICW